MLTSTTNETPPDDIPKTAAEIRLRHRRAWRFNPTHFITETLDTSIWDKQGGIINALRNNRRVAVRSCNGSGKTYAAACAVIWWLLAWGSSIAITTAPTNHQVRDLLWREIRRIYTRNAALIGGEITKTGLDIAERNYAIGLSTDAPERFQGFHEGNILFVVDEASGVSEDIYEAIEGCMTSAGARLLLIGNPTRRSGTFFRAFHEERALWYQIHISAPETPNLVSDADFMPGLVTRKWVDEAARK